MARLHSLIRFRRHELDEKRQVLAALNAELYALEDQKSALLQKLAHEKTLASVDPEIARGFGLYLNKTLKRCEELDVLIAAKRQDVMAATQVVQDAFMEVKKLEITQENRDARAAKEAARVETIQLDDIGLTQFTRTQKSAD